MTERGAYSTVDVRLGAEGAAGEAPTRDTPSEIPWQELVGIVRGAVRRLAGPSADADDLAQSALEQVVRGLPRFEGRAELSTFVYRIAAHVVMNHWRSWRRWLKQFELGTLDHACADDTEPSELVSAHQRAIHLHRLLDAMDAKKRIVLVLAELEELPASQIAVILECPEPTVRSRLRLARDELTALVQNDPFFREERAR